MVKDIRLDAVLGRATQPHPNDRYQQVEGLIRDLEPIQAKPRMRVLTLDVFCLLLAGVIAFLLYRIVRAGYNVSCHTLLFLAAWHILTRYWYSRWLLTATAALAVASGLYVTGTGEFLYLRRISLGDDVDWVWKVLETLAVYGNLVLLELVIKVNFRPAFRRFLTSKEVPLRNLLEHPSLFLVITLGALSWLHLWNWRLTPSNEDSTPFYWAIAWAVLAIVLTSPAFRRRGAPGSPLSISRLENSE
jgi:hypothetical protein